MLGESRCCPACCWWSCWAAGFSLEPDFYHSSAVAHGFLAEANVSAALKSSRLEAALCTVRSGDRCR